MMRSLFVSIVLMAAASVPAAAKPLQRLEYRNDRVTLRADDTPLADVIDSLKRHSGAQVKGTAPDTAVSADLDAVPLREALERLLGEHSFTLTYGDKGKLKTIELKGGPVEAKAKAEEPPAETPNLGAHDGKTPAHWVAVLDGFAAPVPVTGRLRELAGTEKAGWDFVLTQASQHGDPALRADAIRAGVRAIEDDPANQGVIGALQRMDDDQLAAYVRAMARSVDDEPVTFVKDIVRYSHDSELRARARKVVRQIRTEDRAAKRAAGGAA